MHFPELNFLTKCTKES